MTTLRPSCEQHRRCHWPSKKCIYHPDRKPGELGNQQQHPMRREPVCLESTPFPEGKPTCLTSSPPKEGVVLWELSNFWEETGLLWSTLAKNVSAPKVLLPCSVFGWAVTVDKGDPGRVLAANSSHWVREVEARIYFAEAWELSTEDDKKSLILETYNVVSDHWTCWACSALWQMLIFTKQIWSVIFSIDLNMFKNINILHKGASQIEPHHGPSMRTQSLDDEQDACIHPSIHEYTLKSLKWFKSCFVSLSLANTHASRHVCWLGCHCHTGTQQQPGDWCVSSLLLGG